MVATKRLRVASGDSSADAVSHRAGRDSRVEAGGDVEGAVIGASVSGDPVAVAQVADDVVRGPVGAPGRGGPVVGAESLQDRDEPSPLLAEYLD